MHKIKAYIYGCEIYWDGYNYVIHHNQENINHNAPTIEDAFVIAKNIGEKYPIQLAEDGIESYNEEMAE